MIHIYAGNDLDYQIHKVQQEIKDRKLTEYDYIELDGRDSDFDIQLFLMELESLSLFVVDKVFVLKNFPGVAYKWPYSKDLATNIIQNIDVSPSWMFFFVNESNKLLKASELMKYFAKNARFHLSTQMSDQELKRTLNHWLQKHLPHLSNDFKQQLYQRISSYTQLQKAMKSLELVDEGLTEAEILQLISDPYEAKIYELCDALLLKQHHQAFQVYHSFKQQFIKPQSIMFQLANQFRQYFQLFTLAKVESNVNILSKKLGMSERQIGYILQRKRHIIQPNRALFYLHQLSILDQEMKFGRIEPELALEKFMLEILS